MPGSYSPYYPGGWQDSPSTATPIIAAALNTIENGIKQATAWYNVLAYGADPTGTNDSTSAIQAALTAAVNAGGGTVYLPAGSYKTTSTITGNVNNTTVLIKGDGKWVTTIVYYGSGDCLRLYDSSTYNTRSHHGSAVTGILIDGSNSASGSACAGLHIGDILQLTLDVAVRNWYNNAGSKGAWFDNNYYWTEQARGTVYAQSCSTCVQFDNSANTSGSATGSFDRAVLDFYLISGGYGDGLTLANGAIPLGSRIGIYGNFKTSTTQYAVIRCTGSNAQGSSYFGYTELTADVELDDTAHLAPYTIYYGSSTNGMWKCWGFLNFSQNYAFTPTNAAATTRFDGTILGDANLYPEQRLDTNFATQSIAANAATVTTAGRGFVRLSGAGGYTGLILHAAELPGQMVTLLNVSSGSLTFAASGTSNVADGASDVIAQGLAATYVWDTVTSLWYRTNSAASADWLNVVTMFGADPTGTNDSTPAIQNALTAAAATGGGVYVPAGTYLVSNLTIDSLVTLCGDGSSSVLTAKSGSSGYMIALTHPGTTYRVMIRDLVLKPNTGTLGGIQLDNTGFTSGGGETDTLHTLENVYIQSAGGDAFHLDNNIRSLRMTRCAAYSSGGYGCYVGVGCTDSSFTGSVMGVTALHAWDVAGWNNFFSSCKGFYGGYSGSAFDTTHCGFEVTGKFNTFASCSAQTNALHGFDLNGCVSCTFTGCEADTNGSGTGSNGVGFNTNGATYSAVIGCTGGTAGGETQLYGVQATGTQTGLYLIGNSVTGITAAFHYVSGSGYLLINETTTDLSGVTQVKVASGTQFGSGSQIYSGSGAPNISGAPAGSYYFRTDTPGTANQRIYVATATNTWTGIV